MNTEKEVKIEYQVKDGYLKITFQVYDFEILKYELGGKFTTSFKLGDDCAITTEDKEKKIHLFNFNDKEPFYTNKNEGRKIWNAYRNGGFSML